VVAEHLRVRRLSVGLAMFVLVSSCRDATRPIPPQGALFEIRACRGSAHAPSGELFRVRITEPAVVAQAARRVGKGTGLIISGLAEAGDGGFNQYWQWHLDPGSLHFSQVAPEICDGCPSWVTTGVLYCPWSTEVVRRIE
jgi:hypothetical protein